MTRKILTNEQTGSLCMALEHLIHAGINPADALLLLAEDEKDSRCAALLQTMASQVDAGASLAAAVKESGAFAPYVATLLQVGERSGKQEQTLHHLAVHYTDRARMERQLRNALLYPAMLLAVLLAVAVVLLVWVLPVFDDVYARLGSGLTGFAAGLLTFGKIIRQSLPVIIAVAAVVAAVLLIPPVRSRVIYLWQKGMADRGVHKKILSARFVQALAMALSSGMTARETVALAVRMADGESAAFRERCARCFAMVDAEKSLSEALSECGFLSAADRRLLDAGNRSGRGESVLQDIAQDMLEQSEEELQRQSGRIEPILVAFACLLIGGILLSVMLPLMNIMTAIG